MSYPTATLEGFRVDSDAGQNHPSFFLFDGVLGTVPVRAA